MSQFLEYISSNYTWILGGAIVILLAIIGYYADKTNFGQGQKKQNDLKKDLSKQNDVIYEEEKPQEPVDNASNIVSDQKVLEEENKEAEEEQRQKEFNKKLDEFDEVFNETLPEKDIISGDLLDEIDNLSLDKTQKISLDDIPDLDDVDLPKIKKIKSDDGDIWKF